nr:MAG TPA: hypothetical protein [Caudoviricetes sp.]
MLLRVLPVYCLQKAQCYVNSIGFEVKTRVF